MGNGKWAITGLSKTLNSTIHYIYVSFEEDIAAILSRSLHGSIIRPLTYGELGALVAPYGYGVLPYGMQAKFDLDGNLIDFLEE